MRRAESTLVNRPSPVPCPQTLRALLFAQRLAQEFAALLKGIHPLGQLRRRICVRETAQQNARIEGTLGSVENSADGNHSDHPLVAHEAMLKKAPLVVPTHQARMNLESLEHLQITTKLGDDIAHDGKHFVLPRNR